ncbi:sulfatase-like hydrolase/transferase [Aquisphaera insulae]|uniref:sulfatase-like hydrolase/transferase n=1 Tax=Aquisphaera insulae TaxID=2712864 RepID=UPI0013ED87DF|nr:sulfatase-like hydrolase/transferase [Aquisphaera insulae]
MDDLARIQADSRPDRKRLRRLIPRADGPGPQAGIGPKGLLVLALWFGFLTGLVELALVLAQRTLVARISLESLRTNRHFVWMIPVADVAIFGAVGLIFALWERRRPGRVQLPACFTIAAGLSLAAFWSVEWLHTVAGVVISAAVGVKAFGWLNAHAIRIERLARRTLPWMGAGLISLTVVAIAALGSAERRALAAIPAAEPGRPNVLLIVMDDVRAESLSLHGHDRPTTPRLEQIAGKGVRFDSARSTAPWTLPSHASMFTGRWPHDLSVDWTHGLDSSHPTLAGFLADRGYATAGFVANTYYCNARYGLDRGFARYEDYLENLTISPFELLRSSSLGKGILQLMGYSMRFTTGDVDTRKTAATINWSALDWLASRPVDRPFFLFLNYYDAHGPFLPPRDATRRFGLCKLSEREQVEILKHAHETMASPSASADDKARARKVVQDVKRDGYESSIAYLDEQIGRLMDELQSRGLLENTLVIVTSDHGEHFEERGFYGHGLSLYRREIHVPLVVVPPSGAAIARRSIPEPVSLRDIPATVADFAGLGDRSPFPGRSLTRCFRPSSEPASGGVNPVLSEVGHQTTVARTPGVPASLSSVQAVTTDRDVYMRSGDGVEELYDRTADPDETRNRIGAGDDSTADSLRRLLEQVRGE